MTLRTLAPDDKIGITISLNGRPVQVEVDTATTLLDLLRNHLALTGTKKGCDHGQCGACTVLIDGERMNSCLKLAVMMDGREITTIEGLAEGDELHPMQRAFIERDAFQCGYCTPGQICSAVALVEEGHAHSREQIRELMSGNICRCGAYPNIVDAIEDVMAERRGQFREAAE
ncbi:xanthine dehydrogenase YagT iron-sulfur-binding subunit [Bosea sp. BK604]|nr:xanthine dehydrogenase YagT iron-sulfur-binding subunit [Bosea sp. BK604]